MENRRYEQGGVVSFLVIAFALGALLIGGIVLMKNHARTLRDAANTVSVTSPEAKKEDSQPSKDDEKQTTPEQSTETKPAPTPTPTPTTPAAPTPSNSTPQNTPAQTGTTSGTQSPAQRAPATGPTETTNRVAATGPSYGEEEVTGTLPSTGIEDAIAPLVALGGLGAGTYVFAESQRKMRHSALK